MIFIAANPRLARVAPRLAARHGIATQVDGVVDGSAKVSEQTATKNKNSKTWPIITIRSLNLLRVK
jgi:hypothetical protein